MVYLDWGGQDHKKQLFRIKAIFETNLGIYNAWKILNRYKNFTCLWKNGSKSPMDVCSVK